MQTLRIQRHFFPLLFLIVLCGETAQAQINCYTQRLCQGTVTVVSSIRECCLTRDGVTLAGGMSYDSTGEACQTCVVFGWTAGYSFQASEQGEAYSLAVGYLKGADRAPGNGRLRFDVIDTEGTAGEGASNDYRVSNTQNLDVRPTRNVTVQVTFRVDNVALEPDETLELTLDPGNTLAMALDSNVFLLETIQLTIQDSDVCATTTGLDLFFVLDSSVSVNLVDAGNFQRLLESVSDIVGEFDIGLGLTETRVGVIRFASGPDLIFDLDTHTDLSSLQAAILAIPYVSGGSLRIHLALDLLENSFNEANGARSLSLGIPRAAVIIINGLSENPSLTAMAAQTVCESAIIPFAAGIGATFTSNPNTIVPGMAELLAIACGDASRREIAEDFSTEALMELQENITEFGCRECNRTTGLDLFFVLDSSESINFVDSGSFMRLLQSVSDIVAEFDIGLGLTQTRVGVIRFVSVADLIFDLTDHTDLSSLQAAILAIPYVPTGGTRTNEALDLLANTFNEANGARSLSLGIPQRAVIIVDGLSEDPSLTAMAAQSVCESAIIPFAASIGATFTTSPATIMPGIYMAELLAIACGNASRVEIAEDFNTEALMELQEDITYFACDVTRPPLQCLNLIDPVNGMVTFTGTSVGSTAIYTCNSGFELIGTMTRTCEQVDVNTAVWSDEEPVCRHSEQPSTVPTVSGTTTSTTTVTDATSSAGITADPTNATDDSTGFTTTGTEGNAETVSIPSAAGLKSATVGGIVGGGLGLVTILAVTTVLLVVIIKHGKPIMELWRPSTSQGTIKMTDFTSVRSGERTFKMSECAAYTTVQEQQRRGGSEEAHRGDTGQEEPVYEDIPV